MKSAWQPVVWHMWRMDSIERRNIYVNTLTIKFIAAAKDGYSILGFSFSDTKDFITIDGELNEVIKKFNFNISDGD